jgi:16S rRNA (cytosine967-C5)-methyltransferase
VTKRIPQNLRLTDARDVAVGSLGAANVGRGQWRTVEPDCQQLSHVDAQLARALHQTVVQRDITLDYVLGAFARQLTDITRIVLKVGLAQLLFMNRIPDYAAIDRAVDQAKRLDKLAAGKLANAVLRNVTRAIAERCADAPWPRAAQTLPIPGGYIRFTDAVRLSVDDLTTYLHRTTSHPRPLVAAWRKTFGDQRAMGLLEHSLLTPPTIVTAGSDEADHGTSLKPHALPGFGCWVGDHAGLLSYLAANRGHRVQDPTAAAPVAATAHLPIRRAIDYCAGMGTKTRQLLAQHPQAQVLACEIDPRRIEQLQTISHDERRLRARHVDALAELGGSADLLLLDVPCSNTGVLARRLEAKYRYGRRALDELSARQRQIIDRALPLVHPGGWVVYSTCSIEATENQQQARYLTSRGLSLLTEQLTLPAGHGPTYHDGGYFALLRR